MNNVWSDVCVPIEDGTLYYADTPQVHVHYLSDEQDNHCGMIELCCHGCGDAMILVTGSDGGTVQDEVIQSRTGSPSAMPAVPTPACFTSCAQSIAGIHPP